MRFVASTALATFVGVTRVDDDVVGSEDLGSAEINRPFEPCDLVGLWNSNALYVQENWDQGAYGRIKKTEIVFLQENPASRHPSGLCAD